MAGTYAFIETSSPRKNGEIARLRSKIFSFTTGKCMSWWFHMYGASVASLNLYMKQVGQTESLVWNLNGTQVQLCVFMAFMDKCYQISGKTPEAIDKLCNCPQKGLNQRKINKSPYFNQPYTLVTLDNN